MGYFNSKLAREVARSTGWRDKVFSRRYQAILVSDEEEAQIGRLVYVLSHGCKENLVARPQDWPGVHSVTALLTGEPIEGTWFDRTREWEARCGRPPISCGLETLAQAERQRQATRPGLAVPGGIRYIFASLGLASLPTPPAWPTPSSPLEVNVKKTLTFAVSIRAPRRLVWETMLDAEGYKVWTAAFGEGSYFSGSWDRGQRIQFLGPGGDGGMTAVIDENRPYEHISIRHLGEVSAGVEDTTSPKVLAWAPAYEKYWFEDAGADTEVTVSLDTVPEYEKFMLETYPKALGLLKSLCEGKVNA